MCDDKYFRQPTVSNQDNNLNAPKWNEKYAHNFCNNIPHDKVISISNYLDSITPSKMCINEVTERISLVFQEACVKTFPPPHKNTVNRIKPWFGPCCKSARKNII